MLSLPLSSLELTCLPLGFAVGVLAGLFGIGGAIITIPLFTVLPQWFGLPPLSMASITGISAVQALSASVGALSAHWHRKTAQWGQLFPPVLALSVATMAGSTAGGLASGHLSNTTLAFLYVCSNAFLLVVFLRKSRNATPQGANELSSLMPSRSLFQAAWQRHTVKTLLWLILGGGAIGALSGLLGIGGAFYVIPLLMKAFDFPLHQAVIGGSLSVIFIALAATLGKALAGVIPWQLALLFTASSFAGGLWGATLSSRLSERTLTLGFVALLCVCLLRGLWVCWFGL